MFFSLQEKKVKPRNHFNSLCERDNVIRIVKRTETSILLESGYEGKDNVIRIEKGTETSILPDSGDEGKGTDRRKGHRPKKNRI